MKREGKRVVSFVRSRAVLASVAMVTLLAPVGKAAADVMLVDCDATAVTPDLGGAWNELATPTDVPPGNLVNSDATTNGVSLTFTYTGGSGWVDYNTNQGVWGTDRLWVDSEAPRDLFYGAGLNTYTLTIGGLDPGKLYDVQIVAARAASGDRDGDYKVQGAFTSNELSSDDYHADTGWAGRYVLIWSNVSPTAGGDIVLTLEPIGTTHFCYLNALRLEGDLPVWPPVATQGTIVTLR